MNATAWIALGCFLLSAALTVFGCYAQNAIDWIRTWLIPDRKTESDTYNLTNE